MKKVLIIVPTAMLNAGVPRIMMDIYDGLKDEISFDFLTCSPEVGYYDKEIVSSGGRIYYSGLKLGTNWKKKYLYGMFVRPWNVFHIIRRGKYDVVHSNCGFKSGDDMFIASLCGVKNRISHAHGTYNIPSDITKIHPLIGQWLLKKFATHKLAVSRIAGDTLFDGHEYELILNSVDFSQYKSIVKLPHDGINILQVGYFCDNKNQVFTLELCKQIINKGIKLHVYFIGFEIEKDYLDKMKQFVEQNSMQDSVTILAHDYNKFKLYPKIDYIVMPSHSEGLPVVVLESQAARIQCIASTAVTEDVNMGLLKRIPLESIEDWVAYFSAQPTPVSLDESKMKTFSRDTFLNRIRLLYNTQV